MMYQFLSKHPIQSKHYPVGLSPFILSLFLFFLITHSTYAQGTLVSQSTPANRCVVLELFTRNDCEDCPKVARQLKEFSKKRVKIKTHIYNLDEPGKHNQRYEQILKYFRLKKAAVPAIYGCNTLLQKLKPDRSTNLKLESLLTVSVYVRTGCPICARAKVFISKFKLQHPEFQFKEYDLVSNANARTEVQRLATRYRKHAASVPVFHFCNQLMIGWISEQSTGRKLEQRLNYWTRTCPKPEVKKKTKEKKADKQQKNNKKKLNSSILKLKEFRKHLSVENYVDGFNLFRAPFFYAYVEAEEELDSKEDADNKSSSEDFEEDALPPIPGDSSLGPPPSLDGAPPVEGEDHPPPLQLESDIIEVPLFGELSLSRIGMPAFTFLIGLVDGFNPCAMWVLLFLLSVLVNLKSRKKILAVAGTFVIISGLAYFAFMAAWLNVFMLVGYLPAVQLTLGIFSTLIGLIHVKDFFAFKKGITLSIPEWAKPGLYARVRKIVKAENLRGAIVGVIILAVLVNIIELLCTAGLPALYTEILTMQNYPPWKTYAYLGLYISAYMLDDAIMVTIVVVTLGRHKLQEKEGRWLKLFSGVVILALGLVLIFNPSLLH